MQSTRSTRIVTVIALIKQNPMKDINPYINGVTVLFIAEKQISPISVNIVVLYREDEMDISTQGWLFPEVHILLPLDCL